MYGQTEAPQTITTLRKVDHDPRFLKRLGSCGRPHPLVDVKLFDLEMREVDVGEPGEICVRGALVMDGYWKRPELPRRRCAAAGCIPATSRCRTMTAISTSSIARRT